MLACRPLPAGRVKRWASSFARSRTSPTSRSSRIASSLDHAERRVAQLRIVDDALAQRRDVAADRRQRRAQLVRDGHEEVARQLLRLRELRRHVARSATRGGAISSAAARARQLDAVVAGRDLVGCLRERPSGSTSRARQVQPEQPRDDHAAAERDRRAARSASREPAVQLRVRLRDDERAEQVLAELERPSDGEVSAPLCSMSIVDGRFAIERANVDRCLRAARGSRWFESTDPVNAGTQKIAVTAESP